MVHKVEELLKTQKSLTEWLEDIKHKDAATFRKEDNEKRERLRFLNELIGVPYDKPTQFEASQLSLNNPEFARYVHEHGEELCALRLIPKVDGIPKLRMRGRTVRGAFDWYVEQKIDPAKYRADFIPHPPDYSWATIFVVNEQGIQGEIIYGGHHQLTQGFHDNTSPMVFKFDYKNWHITPFNKDALKYLQNLAQYIYVKDVAVQKEVTARLGSSFAHNYLTGYFESTDSSLGTWFIDFSHMLGQMYADMSIRTETRIQDNSIIVRGQTGSPGSSKGVVVIVDKNNIPKTIPEGSVLVCQVTTPDYVPLMQQAVAIITDQGGILSHAAIVARELKKPCIVGTGNATTILTNGQHVYIDATSGAVRLNSRQQS